MGDSWQDAAAKAMPAWGAREGDRPVHAARVAADQLAAGGAGGAPRLSRIA
jgi:hypothetical protein